MRLVRYLGTLLVLGAALAVPARAATGPTITGRGSAGDMTRFALAISGGTGHFECLMPAIMTVEATVTGVTVTSATTATFTGVAAVTLAAHTEFGPPGPLARDASFTTNVTAGGPGTGFVDLTITMMGTTMEFAGTVEHGQINVSP